MVFPNNPPLPKPPVVVVDPNPVLEAAGWDVPKLKGVLAALLLPKRPPPVFCAAGCDPKRPPVFVAAGCDPKRPPVFVAAGCDPNRPPVAGLAPKSPPLVAVLPNPVEVS